MKYWLIIICCLTILITQAQSGKKSLAAIRINSPITIDGQLDEGAWMEAPVASDFIGYTPVPDARPSQRTEVRILYDDQALYVGARMFDTAPDSVLTELGIRDNKNIKADYFALSLDTYNDGQYAFSFGVTASNVQVDSKLLLDDEDNVWSAVWYSAVSVDETGWIAEFRIPYSAIRFPDQGIQLWGINFNRVIRRHREEVYWNRIDPNESGVVSQYGILTGIGDISPPLRLSLTPYVAAYAQTSRAAYSNDGTWNYDFRGGMDLKYGINESFTLDMTLIPDFGQVRSDDKVLNLSPFEVQYDEKRPFFTEGTELFEIGNLFYSRRVGGRPVGYQSVNSQAESQEIILENPAEGRLLNATKLTGRTPDNLGIGIFNAIEGRSFATVIDTLTGNSRKIMTQPVTNYSVIVLNQTLRNRSAISFVNTNVWRGSGFEKANVRGLFGNIRDRSNTYEIRGGSALSQNNIDFKGGGSTDLGFKYNLQLAKVSGTWQYGISRWVESDTYDPNDLGFLYNNNDFNHNAYISYNQNRPGWDKLIKYSLNGGASLVELYQPRKFSTLELTLGGFVLFQGFNAVGLNMACYPKGLYDYFEPRIENAVFFIPPSWDVSGFISTNYNHRLAVDISALYGYTRQFDLSQYNLSISPRFRVNDQIFLIYLTNWDYQLHDRGFAAFDDNGSPVFGRRNLQTVINSLQGRYIFTSRMGLNLYIRHYWSTVQYDTYYDLNEEGSLSARTFDENTDISFSLFNIDLNYTWEFTPGSELSVVWKNEIGDHANIFNPGYFENLNRTFTGASANSFSIKVLYYIDYQRIRGK